MRPRATIINSDESDTMRDVPAIIERITLINPHYQHLHLAVEGEAFKNIKPGESLLARLQPVHSMQDLWEPYLREHWWCVGVSASGLLLVERPTTSRYERGQEIMLLGTVGTPYRFRPQLSNLLLIAYDSPPTPLTIMIPSLLKNKINTTLVLLGDARHYQTEHLSPEVEVIRGNDDMSWDEQVTTLGWADQVFVVVGQDNELMRFHEVLEVFRSRMTDIRKNRIFGVFQPPLPCGVGACSACMIRTGDTLQSVCTRGPAFDLLQVSF